MNLPALSLLGLISLYLIAQVATFIFGIRNDKFYAPFHFVAGVFLGIIFFALSKNPFSTISLTLLAGILWEVYEYSMWKHVLKKSKFKPKRQDTINDLFLDFLGTLLGIFLSGQF
ncbi:MAG: hypothetical protein UX80_C0015G0004 [Candidatus Amesbacteria bacterium GW2011_GWA2_47_11b]|uniref:VanZ-like domain-containing protein n=1 Tax=Candidatus Amesbacteria bacterium GW2011_GWA2_47_11b TaxID=1618358 RepID=A0A0G1UIE0_9BACT|nr:MAG: hypothetical protein UX80_C0015G0004 [Candidatus Amesbacteria bacterium GW2011_GWA2_47_11b]